MSDSRRKHPRIEVSIDAEDTKNQKVLGVIKDISITGCFIETENLVPQDSNVDIKFIVPYELKDISTRGRVASIRHNPDGMGIEFFAMPPEYSKILRAFIKKELGTVKIVDRRKYKRVGLAISIYSPEDQKIGVTNNISASGMNIKSKLNPVQNSQMDIKFSLPQSRRFISIKTKIVRTGEDSFSVTFIEIENQDRESIDQLIKHLGEDFFT